MKIAGVWTSSPAGRPSPKLCPPVWKSPAVALKLCLIVSIRDLYRFPVPRTRGVRQIQSRSGCDSLWKILVRVLELAKSAGFAFAELFDGA
jgi:hypothetical protein